MCGRTGELSVSCTRCFGRSSVNASSSATTTTISHQYSRIRSIVSPGPFSVVTTAKLHEIGEQKAQKEAHHGGGNAFEDQGNARGFGPVGVAGAGNFAEQP